MSIIYDALKKVEKSSSINLKVKTEKESKPKFKIYLLYLLVGCSGLFIANILFSFFARPLKNNINIVAKSQPALKIMHDMDIPLGAPKAAPSLETPISSPEENTKFVLNGLFFSQNEGYALINNRIVKEGDEIEGATVVEIRLNEVELQRAGSIIRLSTESK